MKGNPLLRLCLILLLLSAVLVPVCRLTLTTVESSTESASSSQKSVVRDEGSKAALRGRLLLRAAPSPIRCAVSLGGKTIMTDKNLLSPGEYGTDMEIPPGTDLLITAEWGDRNPHAVRVEFQPEGMTEPITASYWANRSLEDVLTIPESPLP
jgi:hypothetical protein